MRFAVGLVGAMLALGCAAAPKGPRGPLLGPGVKMGLDWSLAFSSASSGDASGTSDHFASPMALPPRRVEVRLAPVDWLDVGVDLGWLDSSLDVRLGIPAAPGRAFAAAWSLGVRTGKVPGLLTKTEDTGGGWLRSEFYPLLFESGSRSSWSQQRAVLSLGLDMGTYYHQLSTSAQGGIEVDPLRELRRKELRFEGAIGLVWVEPRHSVLVALEPYLALERQDTPDYDQSWGVVLVANFAAFKPLSPDGSR